MLSKTRFTLLATGIVSFAHLAFGEHEVVFQLAEYDSVAEESLEKWANYEAQVIATEAFGGTPYLISGLRYGTSFTHTATIGPEMYDIYYTDIHGTSETIFSKSGCQFVKSSTTVAAWCSESRVWRLKYTVAKPENPASATGEHIDDFSTHYRIPWGMNVYTATLTVGDGLVTITESADEGTETVTNEEEQTASSEPAADPIITSSSTWDQVASVPASSGGAVDPIGSTVSSTGNLDASSTPAPSLPSPTSVPATGTGAAPVEATGGAQRSGAFASSLLGILVAFGLMAAL
ncbi:hypothetical protein BKA66DRAFT_601032 [Pyrenochaeta sp. MPI-SDFR-AT-0127]|nr:hypothetical protein BKA66DRAFT_601032 [Pyrenochaeta sp. MPI-SDFR-AT-0127]